MKKILIVNNHKDTMSIIKQILKKNCFEAEYIYRAAGLDVIEKVKEYAPDLVLLEGSIGAEGKLCQKIKNSRANVPVILMAGNISSDKSYENCGADDIISKPFESKLLLKKIDNLLRTG